MSLTSSNGVRPSLTLASLPGMEAAEPLFPVDPEFVVGDRPSLQDGLRAAGVHDLGELAVLAGGVRSLPAA
ncbi:MAG: hypothetical protein ACSLFO_12510 [Acidimicrobiales bacterium]